MSVLGRYYPTFLRVVGGIAVPASIALALYRGVSLEDLLLIGLVVPAAWLRINLEPKGYMTLTPVVIFSGFLLADTSIPLLVAAISPLVGTLVFKGRPSPSSLAEAGEEAIAAIVPIVLVRQLGLQFLGPGNEGWATVFALAAVSYIAIRYGLAGINAKISQRVQFLTFSAAGGKSIAVNLALLAIVAVGMSYLVNIQGRSGYFTLALATIALMEIYHPYKQLSDQRDALFASLAMIAHAIDLKDAYTGRHARDASDIAVRIARAMRLPEAEVSKIRLAGILHDIGKIGVSTKIIRKPAPLEPDEMQQMRRHPIIGAEIMRPVELLGEAAEIVRHHHEHYDGSGYPDGLRGESIPVGSRILLVADAFNAITTDRPYRRRRSKGEALRVLREHARGQFDPSVVDAIESMIDFEQ